MHKMSLYRIRCVLEFCNHSNTYNAAKKLHITRCLVRVYMKQFVEKSVYHFKGVYN